MPERPARDAPSGRSPRVLLVDPYMAREDPMERKLVELYPSLGLLELGAFLRERGVEVRMLDFTFERELAAIDRAIGEYGPDLVGVHTKTLTFDRAVEVADRARAHGIPTLAGGPDSASRPEAYLARGFDAVALGEGELTVTEAAGVAAEGSPLAGVSGLVTVVDGKPVRSRPRPFVRDLDSLPLPAWDLIDMEAYLSDWEERTGERRAAVLTSRGCPFDCSWCSKPTFGRTYRQQSVERVLAELRALKQRYRVDYVRFCDDVFGIQREWLVDLMDRMVREKLDLQFECLARVDLLKPELLESMRHAGLARVYLGVESGSQRMLDAMNRGTNLKQIERASEALRRAGVRQYWFLMLGYPGERLEDIEATLRLFRRFSPEEYSVSIAVPVPGTRFFDAVKERLLGPKSRKRTEGGVSLLFDAAYPESLYRWQQARFRLDAALRQARGKISASVLDELARVSDAFSEKVATPLLTGESAAPAEPRPPTRGPSARSRLRAGRPGDPGRRRG